MKVKSLSRVRLFAIPWAIAYRASPSMGFSRQEYWSGVPLPSPGDLPDPGIEPWSPALEADALTSEPPGKPKVTLTAVKNFKMHSGSNKAGYFCCCHCLVTKLCPTFCDPVDCSPPGFSVHGILQARILEWGAISFSRGSFQPRNQTRVSYMCLLH